MYRDTILKRLKKIEEIPTMLNVALQIDRLTKDDTTSASKISDIIRVDPALTGKVLKVANSAVYASSRRVVSLQQAIARLGFTEVRRICLSIAIINSFKNFFIDYEKFWLHSITTAYLACELNKRCISPVNEDEVYISGILHDTGILILDQYFTTIYKKVFEIASKRTFDLRMVELKILGISHPEVGAFLLSKWNISPGITEIILNHHTPQNAKKSQEIQAKIVYLANFVCNNRGFDNGSGFFPEAFYDDIWNELGLQIDEVPEILEIVVRQTTKARELLRLGGRDD